MDSHGCCTWQNDRDWFNLLSQLWQRRFIIITVLKKSCDSGRLVVQIHCKINIKQNKMLISKTKTSDAAGHQSRISSECEGFRWHHGKWIPPFSIHNDCPPSRHKSSCLCGKCGKIFHVFFLYLTFMNCFDSGRFLNWFNRRRKKKNGGNIGVEWFPRQANMNVVLFMETTHYRQKNSNVVWQLNGTNQKSIRRLKVHNP